MPRAIADRETRVVVIAIRVTDVIAAPAIEIIGERHGHSEKSRGSGGWGSRVFRKVGTCLPWLCKRGAKRRAWAVATPDELWTRGLWLLRSHTHVAH